MKINPALLKRLLLGLLVLIAICLSVVMGLVVIKNKNKGRITKKTRLGENAKEVEKQRKDLKEKCYNIRNPLEN